MENNNFWIQRAIFKLSQLHMNGSAFKEELWELDWDHSLTDEENISNAGKYEQALMTLMQAKVVHATYRPNMEGDDPGIYVWYLEWLDYDHFLQFCELHGLNPSPKGVMATLELVSGVTPVVIAEGKRYSLPALPAGAITQRIVAYAAGHPDTLLDLESLRKNAKATQLTAKGANIRQVFKNNIFRYKLASFAEISPKSFMLKRQALITPDEVESIRMASTD